MPGSGGLSPQEIEARNRAFLSRDLITKTMMFSGGSYTGNPPKPRAIFIPKENYFLTGLDCVSWVPIGGVSMFALSFSPDITWAGSNGSSGVNIFLNFGNGLLDKYMSFEPYGFYLEANRAIYLFGECDRTGPLSGMLGSATMYLIPTWTR